MLTISAKIRKDLGRKVKALREKDILPAILYGPKIKTVPLEMDYKTFEKVYKEAGESSLVKLEIQLDSKKSDSKKKDYLVLIHEIVKDPLSGKLIHIDFYQPDLEKEVEIEVPIIFEGESLAVKDLEGTLVKNIIEIEVKALPQDLPREIKTNIESLKTFGDVILIKDLKVPPGVKFQRDPEEVVASVSAPEKVEEELEKPIEEEVEEKEEKVEEKKEKVEDQPAADQLKDGKKMKKNEKK